MIHDYLKADDDSVWLILADTDQRDRIGCNYLYVHSSARNLSTVSSPTGETYLINLEDWKKPTPSDYVGTIEIKCITST